MRFDTNDSPAYIVDKDGQHEIKPMQSGSTERDLVTEVEELLAKATPPCVCGSKHCDGKTELNGVRFVCASEYGVDTDEYHVDDPEAALYEAAPELLRRLVKEVKRLRSVGTRPDVVIEALGIMQEKYPGQRIDLSVDPDGYCYVTRSDRNGKIYPIAEGATMGDVFED